MKRLLPVLFIALLALEASAGEPPVLKNIRNIAGDYIRFGLPTTFIVDIELPAGGFRGVVKIISGPIKVERRLEQEKGGKLNGLLFRVPILSVKPELKLVFKSDSGEKSETVLDEFTSFLRTLGDDEVLAGILEGRAPPASGSSRFVEIVNVNTIDPDPGLTLETFDVLLRKPVGGRAEHSAVVAVIEPAFRASGGTVLEYERAPEDAPGLESVRPKKRTDIMPGMVFAVEDSMPAPYSGLRKHWAGLIVICSLLLMLFAVRARGLRKKWLVVSGAAAIAVIGCVVFRVFFFTPTPAWLVTVKVIEAEAGDKAPVESRFIGIGTARGNLDMSLPFEYGMLVDVIRRDAVFDEYPVTFAYRDLRRTIFNVETNLQPGRAVLLRMKTPGELAGPVTVETGGRKTTIRNAAGTALRYAFLTDFSMVLPLGSIPFGSSIQIDAAREKTGFNTHLRRFARGCGGEEIIRAVLKTKADRRRGSGVWYLVALGEKGKTFDPGVKVSDRIDAPPLWIIRTPIGPGSF